MIQTIRESPDAEIAKERLIGRFKLTEIQAQAILDMQLRRLAALERQKIEDEVSTCIAEAFQRADADPLADAAFLQPVH